MMEVLKIKINMDRMMVKRNIFQKIWLNHINKLNKFKIYYNKLNKKLIFNIYLKKRNKKLKKVKKYLSLQMSKKLKKNNPTLNPTIKI